MARVLVTRPVPGPGMGLLHASAHQIQVNPTDSLMARSDLLVAVAGADAVLTQLADRVDAELMDAAGPGLKVLSQFAVGYNNVDVPAATQRGIRVCNTPRVLTDATADIAWTLLMGVARRVFEGEQLMRSGKPWGFSPTMLMGGDLVGKTLAILGAGRIGYAVAKRAMGWDMKIIYVARSVHAEFESDFNAVRVDLDEALRTADFVSLHTPLSDETRHYISSRELGLMKSSAYLINTSRGPVVDEKALVIALQNKQIAGAGLDVYENEPAAAPGLVDCPNTLLLPHLGSATIHTRAEMGRLAAENLLAVLDGREPAHAVN